MGEEFSFFKEKAKRNTVEVRPGIFLSEPTVDNETLKLTEEDVLGKWNESCTKRLTDGMIVARYGDRCPYYGDTVPYKSVTALCDQTQFNEVIYWLDYVYGGGSVRNVRETERGQIAIRADYQAW